MSRVDRLLLVVLLLMTALVAFITWIASPPERTGSTVQQPSTFFNRPYGTKAAYVALNRLGVPAFRLRRPLADYHLEHFGAVFLLEANVALMPAETDALFEWVRAGGTLVVAPETATPPVFVEDPVWPSNWLPDLRSAGPATPTPQPAERPVPTPMDELDRAADHELFSGIETLHLGTRRFTDDQGDGPLASVRFSPICVDAAGMWALEGRLGDGRIIALADSAPFSNAALRHDGNAVLLANLAFMLAPPGSDSTIAFDEYHLGFPERESTWIASARLILDERWRAPILQAAIVAGLALFAAGVRFGRGKGVTVRLRRHQGEFAVAAGRLLRDAGATPLVARTLIEYHRGRLCQRLHLDGSRTDAEVSDRMRRLTGTNIEALLTDARAWLASAPVRPATLLSVVNRFCESVERVEHGHSTGHSNR